MKTPAFSLLLVLVALFVLPVDSFAAGKKTVKGTIFKDPNGNNRLDPNEKGGTAATIWLYRVFPDGSVRKIRRVRTDQVGNYSIPNVPFGRYFLAVRYGNGTLAVRTGVFRVGPRGTGSVRNIPLVTRATLNNNPAYRGYTTTTTPDNLNQGPTTPVSPSAP